MTYLVMSKGGCYRSYYVKGKEIGQISFFDMNGVVVANKCGWLSGEYGKDLKVILDKEPIRKLKADFMKLYTDLQPFYMDAERDYGGSKETVMTLFIPFIPDDWEIEKEDKNF